MTVWQAGMRITAGRLSDTTPDETTTTGLTAATGWSVNDFDGYKKFGVCTVRLYLKRTGATISASGGNIPDTQMCTLPQGYRPKSTLSAVWGDGTASGEAIVASNGVVTLRTSSGDIVGEASSPGNGRNVRLTLTFVDPQ